MGMTFRRQVQVHPERTVLDRLIQVDVCSAYEAEVSLDRVRPADAFDLTLLDRAQQFRLKFNPQVADFVEKQRSAARQLEFSQLLADGSRERTLFMSEEGALHEFLRDAARFTGTNGLAGSADSR
jgi:hypothetical protein